MSGRVRRRLVVNGAEVEVAVRPGQTLLEVLREELGLTGAKAACEAGACGACTVVLDGETVLSCVVYALLADGPVETVEGLAAEARPLREAFADRGAFQCGFCTPGQLVQAWAVARAGDGSRASSPRVAPAEAMSGNLCRCTGYQPILEALDDVRGADGRPAGG